MQQNPENPNELLELLLDKCDRLYQENMLLKGKLEDRTDVDALKSGYERTLSEKDERILDLEKQVAYLRRRIWGKSSERFIKEDPQQRRIDFEGLDLLPEEKELAEAAREEIQAFRERRVTERVKRKPVRKPLPEDLPRVEEHLYPEETTVNTGAWTELEPEVTEVLEHEPGRYHVRRIIRHKYVRKDKQRQDDNPVVTAPLPAKYRPIPRSYAGASLLAELMVNKYVNHLPFYRQIEMMKRLGANLPPPTVNDWFKDTADLLRPLYHRLRELVLATDYIQVDETTIPVINNEKHKTVNGYMWMVRSVMDSRLFFHYDGGSRAQKVALALLEDFRGALQTDGYGVYEMYEHKKGVLPLGCWAHARRKFSDSIKNDRARAEYALSQIGLLYGVEREADERNLTYDERADLRERLAYPIMVAFEKWLVNEYPKVMPKSPIGKAIKYCHDIYHRLTRYHLDGRYRIDNNLAENALRGLSLGRKNYLFAGNHDAAEDAAVFYSLLGCCKSAGVDFRGWMIHVLAHIHDYDNDYSRDLAELLPDRWVQEKS
ncbi:IS66 family transposase [Proteiniphilum sp. X52]|uniref:IS66 family transposase n=1 Tax=Proteiniphilum sp. X52 TaxID=2382159 RepID=UPI000F09A579|nr:IS66 family transposase [Proteiniphilum sp. X52]RNC64445.1 IS66 family transposase [Proteiniphilum sp. X52]